MRFAIFLAAMMSVLLSVLGAAVPEPQRKPDSASRDERGLSTAPISARQNTTDEHPLCGAFAWWNNGKWQEEKLWETRTCLYMWHNVGKVDVEDWGKCELCFFFPSKDCTGRNTLTIDANHGWTDTRGDVWSYYCFLKGTSQPNGLSEGLPVRPELERKAIFHFLRLPAELRNMIYSYATTPVHDPQGGRVCLIHQEPGEYRDFTGLPHVCKTIHKEYTTTLVRNTMVTVRAEEVSVYVDTFYSDRDGALKYGDLRVIYTAYGEPLVGSSLCENFKHESRNLDVLQLLEVQFRLPRMRVAFLCYMLSFANKEPMLWHDLTEDFNELFSAIPVGGPSQPGADYLPSILPAMVGYFANRTDYELSVSSRWPKPSDQLSYYPAIVFNVKTLLPHSHTFWNVDEVIELEEVRPRYDIYKMMTFLFQTDLHERWAEEWFLNFQLDTRSHTNDAPINFMGDHTSPHVDDAPEVTEGYEEGESAGTSAHQHADMVQEAYAAHAGGDQREEPGHASPGLPFRPHVEPNDSYGWEEYQTITCRLPLLHYSLEELRVMDYHHGHGSYYSLLAATPPARYEDLSEEEEVPSVFRELLEEVGLTLEDE
ncbi:uncharacterized protein N0V89_008139 [Didymosphaeria variabile]|uniref:Nudix hydrolase domain-containing protein n=1 Tax=Didymosphaeria variabile TaxID=1932322 RepID=A0A9W9C8K3_9PLEO|nr:uncharacterized protein N0V89_008139 [Didymosphaeria variabile]KAJ4349523.1 hypothetical protein N0V89_008139 [Didymosphaeria variabile]